MAGIFYLYELRDRVKIAVILSDSLRKNVQECAELRKNVRE